jgi:hypothetical protein
MSWLRIPADQPEIKELVREIIKTTGDLDIHTVILPALLHVLAFFMAQEKCADCRRTFAESLQETVVPAMLRDANEFAEWLARRHH